MVSLHAPSASAIANAIPARADALPSLTMTFTLSGLPAVPAGTNASRRRRKLKRKNPAAAGGVQIVLAPRCANRATDRRPGSAGRALRAGRRLRLDRQQALALQLLAGELTRPPDGLGLLARPLLRRFLVMAAQLHLAENSLALHLLLERLEGLVDVVVANEHLQRAILCCEVGPRRIRDCAKDARARFRGGGAPTWARHYQKRAALSSEGCAAPSRSSRSSVFPRRSGRGIERQSQEFWS